MNLIDKLHEDITAHKTVKVRHVCREAGIPESTYYRALERKSCTLTVYELLVGAFHRLQKL